MEREKLEYKHRELIAPMMREIKIPLSEYCFANLYFFRTTHEYEVLKSGEFYFISGLSYDKKRYLMPLMDLRESQDYTRELVRISKEDDYDMIFPVPEEWLPSLKEWNFFSDFLEQDSDYLYTTEKMQHYPGRKLHKKRNLLKQYQTLYCPHVEELRDDNTHETLDLLDSWQNSSTQEMGDSDYYQCREALEKREQFCLRGAIFYADNKPSGFMLGEEVSPDVFTIHFAKGDVNYKGIYQFMFNRFAEHFCRGFKEINLEQDLGMEGLRKTKRSYQPDRMALKYRVHLKQKAPVDSDTTETDPEKD
ncbi:MAG: DUF2156 domain-containing protein [Spirochaetales bacterium]|nr:DUF2156 domain-containing protein [Spirochaetales bacterium]